MKKSNVQLNKVYAVKVSGSVVPVRLDRENPHGGWDGTNAKTGKTVRIASAQRLRGLWPKKTLPITPEAAQAIHHADQENARLNEERQQSPDGQTASERAMATSAARAKRGRKAASKASGEPGGDTGQPDATGAKPERNSLLNLAAKVLAESSEPLNCQQMVERVLATGLWQSAGKTPAATLSSAILREVTTKGPASRFVKVERGKFKAAAQ
ncbi:MAG TPA: winged helix-turn-helix domain-containing protein [Phycisphaerae bacterium]|mgnify:CR=1 FL=1|nr:winged helix-turn-helix domain-containing protein [Phycisphaerae bacterium]